MEALQAFWLETIAPMVDPLNQYDIHWREVLLFAIGGLMFFIAATLWKLRGLYRRVLEQEDGNAQALRPASDLEAELRRLREDVDTLRAELVRMESRRHNRGSYGDASELARQGIPVHAIADQCEISIAEAEMVQAMNRTHALAR